MRTPPACRVSCRDRTAAGISSLSVSVGKVRVRALILRQQTTVVVVAVLIGVTSVILGLASVRSIAVSVDMGLDKGLLDRGGMGIVVLAVNVLSLIAIAVFGLGLAAAILTPTRIAGAVAAVLAWTAESTVAARTVPAGVI